MLCSGDAPGSEDVTAAVPERHRGEEELEEQPRVEENRGTEALPGEQSSEGCTGKLLFHGPELPEALPGAALNKDQVNKAAALGRGRGSRSSRGTQGLEEQQQQRVLQAGKEQRPGHSSLGKALSSCRILLALEPSEMQNAGWGTGVASHPAVTCCHISPASLEAD